MSYNTLKITAGRELFTLVELDLDTCLNTYGVAPCTASGATGSECYNTFSTCQDTPNYSKGTKTYYFTYDQPNLPRGLNYFPCLLDVKITSARITPSEGLGARATIKITLQDFSDTDRYTDKYVDTRSYTPINQGTFFGKLLSRSPNYQNRLVRVRTGYLTDPIDTTNNFKTRLYTIEKITGPDQDGKVTVTGRDLLFATQNFTAPISNKGKLTAQLIAGETGTFTIDEDGASFPAASGTVRIGSEIIQYATRTGNVFSTLTRGTNGTAATVHNANAAVQLCAVFTATNVVDVINTLLTTYAGISSSYIPTTEWNAEKAAWLSTYSLTTVITKPTKVSVLLSELTEQCLLDIWFDDVDQQIKLKAFAPPQLNTPVNVITEDNIIGDSVKVEDMPDKRLTRVSVYFAVINYAEEITEEKNFENIHLRIDTDAESSNEFGDQKAKKIFSRWFGPNDLSLATTLAGRLLNRFSATPSRIKFRLDMKDDAFGTGDFASFTSKKIQQASGASRTLDIQLIETQELEEGHLVEVTALNSGFDNKYAFIGPASLGDFIVETEDNKRKYCFISGADGKMSDGSPGYLIL